MSLNTNDIKKLEEYFVNYEDLKLKRQLRELELLSHVTDDTLGIKIKSLPSSSVERDVIKLSQDRRYTNLDNIIKAIEEIYKTAGDIEKTIIECRYWKKDISAYEWEDIAHSLTLMRDDNKIVSRNATLNARNKLLEEFAELIGWVI